jgi:acyl-CoA synthetase (AMP-forming)/AMP-acid ligase II
MSNRSTAQFTDLVERVLVHVDSQPDKKAIIFGDVHLSYRDFGANVLSWSRCIGRLVANQDVVLVFLPQIPEAIGCFFGAMHAGAVPSFMPLPSAKQDPARYWEGHRKLLALIRPAVLITTAEHAAALRQLCDDSGSRVVAFEELPTHAASADPVPPRRTPAPGDMALLQHSSGTTGLKKGVTLTHAAIAQQIDDYAGVLGVGRGDVVVSWLPMYHDMGLIACTLMPMLLGQTLVLLDPFEWVSAPASLFEALCKHGGHWVWLPNFAFEHLRRTVRSTPGQYDLSGVKGLINCSEPCKAVTFDRFIQAFEALGVRRDQLQVCYAMAETVFAVSQTQPGRDVQRLRVHGNRLAVQEVVPAASGDVELLSCGRPLPGCEVLINHEASDAFASPVVNIGEIVIAAPYLFSGYLHRPEATTQVLKSGRYSTRDLGFMHEGELYVLGRKDDLLICNGRNYFAHEIEQIANHVEGLKAGRNVAVDVLNAEIGSNEIYLVQEAPQQTRAEARALTRHVREAVQEQLSLTLREVVLVPAGWLVKTTSGKISREANKAKLIGELAARKTSAARH